MRAPPKMATAGDYGAAAGPIAVDVCARVVSTNGVTSPLTGRRAALVHIAVLTQARGFAEDTSDEGLGLEEIGSVVLGDLVTLAIEAGSRSAAPLKLEGAVVRLVARRAILQGVTLARAIALREVPPELVPLLSHVVGGGVPRYRERLICCGDRVRLRAVVERTRRVPVVPGADAVAAAFSVRDDLGPVRLDELLEDA